MSQDDFKPSTRKLFQAMGYGQHHYKSPHEENLLLRGVAPNMASRAYKELDLRNYQESVWPIDAAIVAAAREALQETSDDDAGQALAYVVVRGGVEDDEVLARLNPWDRLLFRWRADKLSAADVAAILRESGASDGITPEHLAMIDDWLAKPISALDDWVFILDALFGFKRRLVICAVRNKAGGPMHNELFQEMLAKASPPIEIEDVSQRWHADLVEINVPVTFTVNLGDGKSATIDSVRTHKDQGSGLVKFTHAGKQHGFMYGDYGSWMDLDAVVNAVDQFMAELNRPDRVFLFAIPRAESGEHRAFVVADAGRFRQAAERLALPV